MSQPHTISTDTQSSESAQGGDTGTGTVFVIDVSASTSVWVEVIQTETATVWVQPSSVLADAPRLYGGVLVPKCRHRRAPRRRRAAPRHLVRRRGHLQRRAPRARPVRTSGQSVGRQRGSDPPGGEGDPDSKHRLGSGL